MQQCCHFISQAEQLHAQINDAKSMPKPTEKDLKRYASVNGTAGCCCPNAFCRIGSDSARSGMTANTHQRLDCRSRSMTSNEGLDPDDIQPMRQHCLLESCRLKSIVLQHRWEIFSVNVELESTRLMCDKVRPLLSLQSVLGQQCHR